MISSRNSLKTPSWSIPASSTPRSLTNFTRMTPLIEFTGSLRSWSYPSWQEVNCNQKERLWFCSFVKFGNKQRTVKVVPPASVSGGWWCEWRVGKQNSFLSNPNFLFPLWRCFWTATPSKIKEQEENIKSDKNTTFLFKCRVAFPYIFMWNNMWDVLQQKLGSFLAFLQLLEQQTRFQIPESDKGNMNKH